MPNSHFGNTDSIQLDEIRLRIKKLELFLAKIDSRLAHKQTKLADSIQSMTTKDKKLVKQGLEILNLDHNKKEV
jgi:hypothetical protein